MVACKAIYSTAKASWAWTRMGGGMGGGVGGWGVVLTESIICFIPMEIFKPVMEKIQADKNSGRATEIAPMI